jgi:hypothetical protein
MAGKKHPAQKRQKKGEDLTSVKRTILKNPLSATIKP